MKNSIKLSLLASILLITGCITPLPISQLEPQREDSRWDSGREYLSQTENSVTVTLSYYRNEDNILVFDVVVDNQSGNEFEAHSGQWTITSQKFNKDTIDILAPEDPEAILLEFDKVESIQKARIANDQVTNVILATADLAATIADEANPNVSRAEANARFNNRMIWSKDRQVDLGRQSAYLNEIQNTRQYWEEAPLRRTTLGSKEYISGRLFFEREMTAKFYSIRAVIPEIGTFTFDFEQWLIPAR